MRQQLLRQMLVLDSSLHLSFLLVVQTRCSLFSRSQYDWYDRGVMSKPSKISILASKIYATLRECEAEYTPVELYSMQMILKEELARSWLFDVLSAADRAVVISPEQKQLYETSCQSLPGSEAGQVRERREWLEKKIATSRSQEILHKSHQQSSYNPFHAAVTRLAPAISCSRVLDDLVSVMSQVCDKNPGGADVDLVKLSHDVSYRLSTVPIVVKHLMFRDLDEYLTRLALDDTSVSDQQEQKRQQLKSLLLLLESRLDRVEERMCKFLYSIEKRKGCWMREVSRLLCEAANNDCKLKLLGVRAAPHHKYSDFEEADQALDSVVIDSSLVAEDELDVHLRQLEQKIRAD